MFFFISMSSSAYSNVYKMIRRTVADTGEYSGWLQRAFFPKKVKYIENN